MQNHHSLKYIEDNYLLLLIILLGAVLRIYDLGGESIWLDEAYTIEISKQNPVEIIKDILTDNENHPPFYYSLMHYWMVLFGDSVFSVRFPSVIFGVLCIIAIYKMAKLLFDKNTALFSALILATSVMLIELSQEARSYSLLAFLSILSFYFFTKLLEQKSFGASALYVVSSLLLISTHYYAIFVLVSQNIFILTIYLLSTKVTVLSFRRWILLQIILFVLFLPHLYLIAHAGATKEGLWFSAPNLKSIPGSILSYSGSLPLFFLFFVLSIFAVFNLGYILRVKSLNGYIRSLYDKSGVSGLTYIQKMYLLVLWISIPIIIPFLISVFITPVYQVRYAVGGAAAFFIIVAKGVESLGNKKIIAFVAGVILILSLLNVREYYVEVNKHQWRETLTYLESVADAGELIMVSPDYELISGLYTLKRDDLEMIEFSGESLSALDKDNYNFWVIMSWHGSAGKESLTHELLEDYNLESFKEFHKLKLYHYRK